MNSSSFRIDTDRLVLRPWAEDDRSSFARLNTDHEVMADLGGPLTRSESDEKLDRYLDTYTRHGFTRWAIERRTDDDGREFIGYAGGAWAAPTHPLGAHVDVGWRLVRRAWGFGYATEAARAALDDVFDRIGLAEVLAYTSPDNHRSRAVMDRLGLDRRREDNFELLDDRVGSWTGQVWAAQGS